MGVKKTGGKKNKTPAGGADARADFKEKYLTCIPEAQRNFYSPRDLEAFLEARWDFFRNRTEQVKIRAYNPGKEMFWMVNSSVVEMVKPDTQFILETIVDYCNSRRYKINVIIHPIFEVHREASGKITALDFPKRERRRELESYVYLEIGRLPESELKQFQKDLNENLRELDVIIADYERAIEAMTHLDLDPVAREDAEWIESNLIVLGSAQLKDGRLLAPATGILRKKSEREAALKSLATRKLNPRARIEYFETDLISRVNRGKPLYFVVFSDGRQQLLYVGHFARRAEFTSRYTIPVMRRRLGRVADDLHAAPTSFLQKRILSLAQMVPIELLFTRSIKLLHAWFEYFIANIYTDETEFTTIVDDSYDVLWVLAVVPRREADQFPGRRFQNFARENGVEVAHEIRGEIGSNLVLYLGLTAKDHRAVRIQKLIGEDPGDIFATWTSRFRKTIANRYVGDAHIAGRMNLFFTGISPEYEIQQTPEEAVFDLEKLEEMDAAAGYQVHYYGRTGAREDCIKVYTDTPTLLSDLVPVLTNFGFAVLREYTFPFESSQGRRYTYAFVVPPALEGDRQGRRRVADAIAAVLNRKTTSDPLDRLTVAAGIDFHELILVKAFVGYHWQIDRSYARLSLQNVFIKYPAFTSALVSFFHARFRPEPADDADGEARAEAALEESLQALDTVVEESICRNFIAIVRAIVRTNYYLKRQDLSFKIESAKIENIPRPVPLFEIFVFGYDLEGIHLRGGRVARGGLRWSDRTDDYRTEILGLMKAQMVKNTVIVPEGSKGGFVLKHRTFAGRDDFRAAGVAAYKRYIEALLEITDNLNHKDQAELDESIRRRDDVDPYLVVAADKGTATFSDIANEISLGRGFWLLDAFASGGANGYDHKKQGITARGAWESVRRHFHEMGMHPERDRISVAAIGDMGGDVFGNGMLLSASMQLVAAFNHLHIFLDPDPDPAASYKERQRLFEKVAGWDEYDTKLISNGGGIFDRASRKISLTKQIQNRLGLKVSSLSGEDLIKAILRAPVDLLWNGGIGTYIKAAGETHFQAGDPSNDRVRIDATELRAKVVGEGGNLGLTQAGRVEAADRGIRLNTDAIDNSAGVDMSDHEVNLKILLNPLVRKKKITMAERNRLIRKLDAREIELVLDNNVENNLALSVDTRRVPGQFSYFRELIKFLNREGYFSREADSIPFETDLDRIEKSNPALSRPVLSSLMGFSKLHVARQLAADPKNFTDAWYDRFIQRYFPVELGKKYGKEILAHPLKREIVITRAVNLVVNQAGIVYFQRMKMRTGASEFEIADTYLRLAEFLDLAGLRDGFVQGNGWISPDIHYSYLILLEDKIFNINRKLLEQPELRASVFRNADGMGRIIEEAAGNSGFRPTRELRSALRGLEAESGEHTLKAFRRVDVLEDAFNIYLRQNRKPPVRWKAADYFRIIGEYRISEMRQTVAGLKPASPWEILFLSRIEAAIDELVWSLLDRPPGSAPSAEIVGIMEELLQHGTGGNLTTAGAFEMLEQAARRAKE